MAGLFLVQTSDPRFAETAVAAARRQFARHGFGEPAEIALPGWRVVHAPPIHGGPPGLLQRGEDLVLVAGTLACDGKIGRPALEALLDDIALPDPDWARLGGQFVAVVRREGRTFLLTDWFGAFQIFHDSGRRLFSTSLLAACEALPRLSFDPQGVYELAFNVAPIGNDTVLAELKTLGPDVVLELGPEGIVDHPVAKPLPDRVTDEPAAERIAAHRAALEGIVDAHVGGFGNRVRCPLSGGLDSRLVLASLRAAGCRPDVFVYGDADDADVAIARSIGAAEGFAVEWFDKEGYREVPPEAFAEQVERNFQDYDGLPNFGELFENGGNAAARDARHRDGALAVSGGCGEIFRNFFFLGNGRFSAEAVARTFFARFDPRDVTARFEEPAFLAALAGKIGAALGGAAPGEPLMRAPIEQIYPRVRCRALFGREISLEARSGAYLMPFLDHKLVAEAVTLPLPLKDAGRFEAMLIHAIDPALARHPSAYGHAFDRAPGLRHRLEEWSSRARPVWLRQRSYALQRRLGPIADEHGGLLGREYLGRVIDLDFPLMRRFFRTGRIADRGLMRRVANLEYFGQRLGSRLVT